MFTRKAYVGDNALTLTLFKNDAYLAVSVG